MSQVNPGFDISKISDEVLEEMLKDEDLLADIASSLKPPATMVDIKLKVATELHEARGIIGGWEMTDIIDDLHHRFPSIGLLDESQSYIRSVMVHEHKISNPRDVAMQALIASGVPYQEIEGRIEDGEYQWDGTVLTIPKGYKAHEIIHEMFHWIVAPPERRLLPEYGLGPGFDCGNWEGASEAQCIDSDEAENEEILTCLCAARMAYKLGIENVSTLHDEQMIDHLPVREVAWKRFIERTDLVEETDRIVSACSRMVNDREAVLDGEGLRCNPEIPVPGMG